MKIKIVIISAVIASNMGCMAYGNDDTTRVDAETAQVEIIQASEVDWTHLNPKRGDLAPKAGTLWGDRDGTEPTGFLLKPPTDFASPPHIHNVSYRGIVIRGVIHNDDPDAAEMWLPEGSFWTQPKGEVHITSAQGSDSLAYIEIEKGPYLVMPSEEAFDSGERPVNIDESNVVWLDAADIKWIEQAAGAQVAFLWGSRQDGELNGTLIKLPAGFAGTITSHGSRFRAVVIKGMPIYQLPDGSKMLAPGSYIGADAETVHHVSSSADEETVIYVRSDGPYDIAAGQNRMSKEEPQEKINRFKLPDVNALPTDIQQALMDAQERLGFVPNVLLVLARRPAEYRAFMAYNKALMNREGGLTPADREMMILAVSSANGCQYCVISHGARLRILTKEPTISDRVAVNYREVDLSPRQRAMIDFAMKVSTDSRSVSEDDFKILRAHGFTDEDIWDIAGITAFYGLSNRMMNVAAVVPDEAFYMMGR